MKKISVILSIVLMVLFASCGETLPVQTSSHEAEGLIELMQLRDDKIGELLPLLKVRLQDQ